jgi:hypothetical protein
MSTASPTAAPRASNRVSPSRFWLAYLGGGVALGAAISTLNFAYYFPLTASVDSVGFLSFLSLMTEWCGESTLLALIVGATQRCIGPRDFRNRELALTVALGAILAVVCWQVFTLLVLREALGIRLLRDYMGMPVIWIGGVFYHAWMMLFFGGLAAAVYASRQRRARMLRALHEAQLRRASAQHRYAQATLAVLQAQLDPDHLVRSLMLLEQAYDGDSGKADELLDELISFLRKALANIRASALGCLPTDEGAMNELV